MPLSSAAISKTSISLRNYSCTGTGSSFTVGSARCAGVIDSNLNTPIEPTDVLLSLLDAGGNALMSWKFVNAWPVKWSVSHLAADKNELVVETIELAYSYFVKTDGDPVQVSAS
jgi:hypothetical protein